MSKAELSSDGKPRCRWSSSVSEFFRYHDTEWGFPEGDDHRLFEKLCLESFQSGLSWRTILAKRENFRAAFDEFDFDRIALYREHDIDRLLNDKGIVRHRGKIEAVVNNARRAIELAKRDGSLAAYFWTFEPGAQDLAEPQSASKSAKSVELSKALKKQGWRFVGPTTVYAFMQATGLINDHAEDCVIRAEVTRTRQAFNKPER